MPILRWLAVLLALIAAPLAAAPIASVTSPDGRLSVAITFDTDGRASYAVNRGGIPVIAESRLGFLFADGPKFERNLKLAGQSTRSADDTWEQPWGERRFIRDRYNEITVRLEESKVPGIGYQPRHIDVVFRVFDDGVGFRYAFEDRGPVAIADELTEFNFGRAGHRLVDPGGRVEPL